MKVLFLDIDGVLNSQRSCLAFGGYPYEAVGADRDRFDEVALRLIRGIVAEADASIVLSSSWRITNSLHELANGLDLPIMDKTPSLPGVRGEEIDTWLKAHPEVDSYVIVDDDSDMLPHQQDRFVHTNHADGFLYKDALRMCELFGIQLFDVNRSKD